MTGSGGDISSVIGAGPGQVATGFVPGPQLVDGSRTAVPVACISGRRDGPTVVVSAGAHGDEINAVQAAAALTREIDAGALAGRLVVLPALNPLAFRNRARLSAISPTDRSNLHDSFPGDVGGDTVARLSRTIVETVIDAVSCELIVDLHTGALGNYCRPHSFYSANGAADVVARAHAAALSFGAGAIIRAGAALPAYAAASMIHAFAHERGIAAIGVELGTAVPNEAAQVLDGIAGIRRVLAAMGMLDGEVQPAGVQHLIEDLVDVRAARGGLCLNSAAAGDDVAAGQPLARITDLFGNELEEARSPVGGHIIGMTCLGALNEGERIARIGICSGGGPLR